MQAALTAGDLIKARQIHAWARQNLRHIPAVDRLLSDWALLLSPRWQHTHIGKRVHLRQPTENDAPFMVRCFQDDGFMAQFHPNAPKQRSEVVIRKTLARSALSLPHFKAQHWLVERLPRDGETPVDAAEPIGLISVVDLIVAHRRAELLVGILDANHRGVGLATEATLLALDICFNQVGLNKLTTLVLANNPYSQRSTLALGFEQEGYRKAHFRQPASDEYVDCFENGLTAGTFRKNHRLARLSSRLLGRNIVTNVSR